MTEENNLEIAVYYNYPRLHSRRSYSAVRAIEVELLRESSVYEYTLEYVTTYLPEESLENRMRVLYTIYTSPSSYGMF